MKKAALAKANARLESAREAFERIKSSSQYKEFEVAWVDFLAAVKGVHSIFEASAHPKKSPKAYGWYSRKVRERRTDPLLKYLNAARNADEYGVEPIIHHEPGAFVIGVAGEPVRIEYMGPARDGSGRREIVLNPVEGKLPTMMMTEPQAKLVQVKDERYNDAFEPPMEHLENPLQSGSILEVAALALDYHANLISEAEKFIDEQQT